MGGNCENMKTGSLCCIEGSRTRAGKSYTSAPAPRLLRRHWSSVCTLRKYQLGTKHLTGGVDA